MSDIVDDLKTVASAPNLLGPAAEWCGKAAAEIQRLRDELASARASQDLFLGELRKVFALIMAGDDAEAIAAAIRAEATREGSEG